MNIKSSADLRASRATWRSREIFRYVRWRHYVKTRPTSDLLRAKWYALWDEAHTARVHRDRQLAALKNATVVTHIDEAGVQFIEAREGKVNHPYNDSRGFATVGVGHLLHRSPYTVDDVKHWTLTDAEVGTLLRQDLTRFEAAVRDSFAGSPFATSQSKFNACVSLAFNIGTGGYASSTVARMVKSGNARIASAGFMSWVNPPELRPRRLLERSLFDS